jgi:hypothetical protein
MALAALFRRPPEGERVGGAVLLGWVVLAAATEQFAWVYDPREVMAAVAWTERINVHNFVSSV